MSTSWGLCKDCKWWQIEPKAPVKNSTMGLCIDDKMLKFKLRVSGNSGCNRFMEGKPAHAKGSSGQPPTAKPTGGGATSCAHWLISKPLPAGRDAASRR